MPTWKYCHYQLLVTNTTVQHYQNRHHLIRVQILLFGHMPSCLKSRSLVKFLILDRTNRKAFLQAFALSELRFTARWKRVSLYTVFESLKYFYLLRPWKYCLPVTSNDLQPLKIVLLENVYLVLPLESSHWNESLLSPYRPDYHQKALSCLANVFEILFVTALSPVWVCHDVSEMRWGVWRYVSFADCRMMMMIPCPFDEYRCSRESAFDVSSLAACRCCEWCLTCCVLKTACRSPGVSRTERKRDRVSRVGVPLPSHWPEVPLTTFRCLVQFTYRNSHYYLFVTSLQHLPCHCTTSHRSQSLARVLLP